MNFEKMASSDNEELPSQAPVPGMPLLIKLEDVFMAGPKGLCPA